MTEHPILYRKRLIPDECILLKDDIILSCDSHHIVTKWKALKPKKDLHHGFSCYFLDDHIKISQFRAEDDTFLYWYCDIVDYVIDEEHDCVTSVDLCIDVVIYPDKSYRVLDLDELAQMQEVGKLTDVMLSTALRTTDRLLQKIYNGEFEEYCSFFSFT